MPENDRALKVSSRNTGTLHLVWKHFWKSPIDPFCLALACMQRISYHPAKKGCNIKPWGCQSDCQSHEKPWGCQSDFPKSWKAMRLSQWLFGFIPLKLVETHAHIFHGEVEIYLWIKFFVLKDGTLDLLVSYPRSCYRITFHNLTRSCYRIIFHNLTSCSSNRCLSLIRVTG